MTLFWAAFWNKSWHYQEAGPETSTSSGGAGKAASSARNTERQTEGQGRVTLVTAKPGRGPTERPPKPVWAGPKGKGSERVPLGHEVSASLACWWSWRTRMWTSETRSNGRVGCRPGPRTGIRRRRLRTRNPRAGPHQGSNRVGIRGMIGAEAGVESGRRSAPQPRVAHGDRETRVGSTMPCLARSPTTSALQGTCFVPGPKEKYAGEGKGPQSKKGKRL